MLVCGLKCIYRKYFISKDLKNSWFHSLRCARGRAKQKRVYRSKEDATTICRLHQNPLVFIDYIFKSVWLLSGTFSLSYKYYKIYGNKYRNRTKISWQNYNLHSFRLQGLNSWNVSAVQTILDRFSHYLKIMFLSFWNIKIWRIHFFLIALKNLYVKT